MCMFCFVVQYIDAIHTSAYKLCLQSEKKINEFIKDSLKESLRLEPMDKVCRAIVYVGYCINTSLVSIL